MRDGHFIRRRAPAVLSYLTLGSQELCGRVSHGLSISGADTLFFIYREIKAPDICARSKNLAPFYIYGKVFPLSHL